MDRARIQIGRLSRFGLLEMSRQRLRPSLGESSHIVCPRCVGIGSIRSIESMALAILRLIGEELRKDRTARVIAQVPVGVATYLFNEKREWLRQLEDKSEVELLIVPNENIQTPEYSIRRVRDDELELPENRQLSYLMPTAPAEAEPGSAKERKPPTEAPAVATLLPATPAPSSAVAAPAAASTPAAPSHRGGGFLSWLKGVFGGAPEAAPAAAEPVSSPTPTRSTSSGSGGSRDYGHRRRDGRRDHSRHTRQADSGMRRERGDGRERAESRDRGDRDRHESRDRNRDQERRPRERSGERRSERDASFARTEQNGGRAEPSHAEESERAGRSGEVVPAPGSEMRENGGLDRGERGERRSRRGRRRGRRGGGGRDSAARESGSQNGAPMSSGDEGSAFQGNGTQGYTESAARHPEFSQDEPRESAPAGAAPERAVEQRSPAPEPRPIAHFEPTPPIATSGSDGTAERPAKPVVVWSSGPASPTPRDRGPEE